MKRSPRARTTAKLCESVHQQVNMYALAAGAAGVGMLALAQPAEAKIIYTKTDVNVFNTYPPGFALDLNNDGIADFTFEGFLGFGGSGSCTSSIIFSALSIRPALSGNAIRRQLNGYDAAVLHPGVIVGPKALSSNGLLMGEASITSQCGGGHKGFRGPWENGGKGVLYRFLGLAFKIKGKRHYGWARLNFYGPRGAILTGYAYETTPNKPIITGKTKGPDVITLEPATLGHLAAGASAIPPWRSGK